MCSGSHSSCLSVRMWEEIITIILWFSHVLLMGEKLYGSLTLSGIPHSSTDTSCVSHGTEGWPGPVAWRTGVYVVCVCVCVCVCVHESWAHQLVSAIIILLLSPFVASPPPLTVPPLFLLLLSFLLLTFLTGGDVSCPSDHASRRWTS